jgi:hypothetical protein
MAMHKWDREHPEKRKEYRAKFKENNPDYFYDVDRSDYNTRYYRRNREALNAKAKQRYRDKVTAKFKTT